MPADPALANHENENRDVATVESKIQQMRRRIKELKAANAQQRAIIKARDKHLAALREVAEMPSENDVSDEGDGENEDEDDGMEFSELPEPLWDAHDAVDRCADCTAEVVHGFCTSCTLQYSYESDDEDEMDAERSISTDDACVRGARLLAARGTTPLRDVYEDATPPAGFEGSNKAYAALLARGATRLMIATFHLEFTNATGIVAWADGALYAAWASPIMQKGDFWKIRLGRRIVLGVDDLDGADFLEDFLEDVLMFPDGMWETVEESAGIWVTRPTEDAATRKNFPKPEDRMAPVVWPMSDEMVEERERRECEQKAAAEVDPIIRRDAYEDLSDVGSGDPEIVTEEEHVAFAASDTGSEDEYELMSEDETDAPLLPGEGDQDATLSPDEGLGSVVMADARDDEEDELDTGSDVPGSGWDSQEELSGDDEAELKGQYQGYTPKFWGHPHNLYRPL